MKIEVVVAKGDEAAMRLHGRKKPEEITEEGKNEIERLIMHYGIVVVATVAYSCKEVER